MYLETIKTDEKRKLDLKISRISDWEKKNGKPIIISGPCSAENEAQLINTAKEILGLGIVDLFRAGIWKPRTRPSPFEGVGKKGLLWLMRVKEVTGLPVATEVANAYHVESCLKFGVDVLWIGARTTANPFSVTEIANALKGVDIPVMIKNPVNPDLQLWIGALERISYAGIGKLLAIHRGFSSSNKTPFRNTPKWEIPIELKTLCPDLKIICDPSHIAGNRELIPMVAQKALDLDMSGLMIESHISPENALSDAKQQVTVVDLYKILNGLRVRRTTIDNDRLKGTLDRYRNTIDDLDEKIIQMIATRMKVTDKIGEYKNNNDATALQPNRWNEVLNRCINIGEVMGLNKEFLGNIIQLIHEESINRQNGMMNIKMQ